MTIRVDIPDGVAVPDEWRQRRSISLDEFNAWRQGKRPPKAKGKFAAQAMFNPDLGYRTRSKLEANHGRLLKAEGYEFWPHKKEPPLTGRFFRYEGRRFEFEIRRKSDNALRKVETYLPDYEVWTDGKYHLEEAKGYMDARSKRKIRLMAERFPEIPLAVVTQKELDARYKVWALQDRRRGGSGEIPGWQ